MTRKQRRTRAEAARANGAKSQGPVTPEGKARSAHSGLHHGAFAQTILLQTESPAAFDRLVNDCITDFQPQNESQLKIVYRLAAATWRQQRAEGVEAAMVNEKRAYSKIPMDRPSSSSTSTPMSLPAPASPRATDPNTAAWDTPSLQNVAEGRGHRPPRVYQAGAPQGADLRVLMTALPGPVTVRMTVKLGEPL